MRILVVENGDQVANILKEGFERERYEVVVESTGKDALFRVNTDRFSLVLLDLPLPDRDIFEILAATRKRSLETRVLVLSERATLEDRVMGLNAGADDYIAKPIAFAELMARIRALLRRSRRQESSCLSAGDLMIDFITRKVTRGGVVLQLTSREFELLQYLVQHKEQVVTRDALGCDVWNEVARGPLLDNLIDVHIARLRRKVDLGQPRKLIQTVHGVGFMLHEQD